MSTTQDRPRKRTAIQQAPRQLLNGVERSYIGLLVAISIVRILQVSGMAVTNTFFNVYMDQSLHLPTAQIGMIAAAARLTAVPAALAMAGLAARWGSYRLVLAAGVGTAISLLPLALVPLAGAAAAGFIGVSVASAIRYPSFLVYSMAMVREDQRQTMSGLSEMPAGISFAGMALLGGYMITSVGYTALFLAGAFMVLLGTFFFMVYFRRPRGVAAQSPAPVGIGD